MLKYLSLLLLIVFMVVPARAQTESASSLLDMLALVPDHSASRESIVSYADYRAIEGARGIDTPTTDDLLNRTDLGRQWVAASFGISSGMSLNYIMAGLEDMPGVVGFSFLDTDRSLVFGNPPGMGTILAGSYDPDRISAAFTEAGYEANDFDGMTVFCGLSGCDSGMKMNMQNINPANPFGGQLGRSEPVALLTDLIVNSPDLSVVEAMLDAFKGEQDSLAEAPDYQAVARAAAEQGSINQIQFVNPLDLMVADPAVVFQNVDPELIERLSQSSSDFDPLPVYSLVGFADVWDGSEQHALILLAYGDEANAQTAAEVLAERMEAYVQFSTGQPFSERMADIGATADAPAVYTDAETGYSVAIWSMRYPMPSNELPEDGEPLISSSLGFRFLINALYQRDLHVLALEPMQSE